MTGCTYQPRVELYVRSLCPTGVYQRQEDVIERLNEMDEDDRIDGFSVSVWGERIVPETAGQTEMGATLLDRISRFKQWAQRNDVELPAFSRRSVTNVATDDADAAITLPLTGLAEFIDGELVHVAPCRDGATVRSVDDRVARITTPPEGAPVTDAPQDPATTVGGGSGD